MDVHALHEALLRPESYPEDVDRIIFRETHVSRLYFTERHVYKIKKPVDFGFLDFSTLERRAYYCGEEVRLNRRFCPDTYLGVREIRCSEGSIAIEGPGQTIEYAVYMMRLPEDRMLDRLLASAASSFAGEMERVGRRIAELHRDSAICRGPAEPVDLETVRRNWKENFGQTLPFIGKTLSAGTHRWCSAYVERFLQRNAGLMRRRQEEGFVREGHGDLHAEHICLTDPLRIYDCIEFNRRFRVADLAADLAFLVMDLDYRNRRDLGGILRNAYLATVDGGPGIETLLPFYQVYRAYVRGKVESFLAQDSAAAAMVRQAAATRARRYFALALGYLCPQVLILTCGLMGTGKSTIGKALANFLDGALLRSDRIRKELAGREETENRREGFGEGIYTEEFSRRTYDLLLERCIQSLREGKAVVADASFMRKADRDRFRDTARHLGIPLLILHVHCAEATARLRLDRRQARGRDPSEGRRELFAPQSETFEPPAGPDIIRVDTALDVDYNAQLIFCEILERVGLE